ncbi:MAG: helix-turn-helix domain-containing protein [Bacteroidetes bacterium]|jgi:excisionase family DNA binding protein|nr:helix-turn-helix domain-containing protein [Bacteroidota bacterium]
MDDIILKELHELKKLINEQNLLKKDVLNFSEACQYLDISESHLYKLTSRKQIPHFCPQGKKLYFNRQELDRWLQQNRQNTNDEIEKEATDYILQNRRR